MVRDAGSAARFWSISAAPGPASATLVRMVDREDPAASTAMFRAFAQRREADTKRSVGTVGWIVAGVLLLAAVIVVVALVA